MEGVGRLLKGAPIPKNLSKEERDAYAQVLEEKWLEALDAALPRYEEAIKSAKQLAIAQSPWLDKIKERIKEIKPDAEVLNTDYQPIRGLYAAGELVGGLFYFNYPGGSGLMSGTVFGKIAGTAAGRSGKN